MNTIKTMDMIVKTFDLISKLEQFGPAEPWSVKGKFKFETTVDNFNVRVDYFTDGGKRNAQFYRVSVKDQEKNELFKVEQHKNSGVNTLAVYIQNKEIKEHSAIKSFLDSTGFNGILEKLNEQITNKLENHVKTDSPDSQLVDNVMERINKIRADSSEKKNSIFAVIKKKLLS